MIHCFIAVARAFTISLPMVKDPNGWESRWLRRIHTDPYAQGWRGSTLTSETHEATVQTRFHEMIEYAVIDNGVNSIANPFGPIKSSVVPTNPR
jgi:hypothetical protein